MTGEIIELYKAATNHRVNKYFFRPNKKLRNLINSEGKTKGVDTPLIDEIVNAFHLFFYLEVQTKNTFPELLFQSLIHIFLHADELLHDFFVRAYQGCMAGTFKGHPFVQLPHLMQSGWRKPDALSRLSYGFSCMGHTAEQILHLVVQLSLTTIRR